MPQAKIKRALYFSALNMLKAELSDLEVKELIIVNNPVAVLSDGHNEHAKELKENLKKQCDLRGAVKDAERKPLGASKDIPATAPSREGEAYSETT